MPLDLSQGNKYNYDSLSGTFVNTKHQQVAEIINDYNPELKLVWIPYADRTAEDSTPYSVVHFQSDGQQYPIFHLSELDLENPAAIITRLFAGDMAKHKDITILDMIEIAERAEEVVRAKEEMEKREENKDLVKHIIKSKKSVYRHNGVEYR